MMEKTLSLDEIVSIEEVGERECYDFNMPTGCFFAKDFLIHNSDIVLLLHWPYKYGHKDKYHFELHIAKNKLGETGWRNLRYEPEYCKFSEILIHPKPINVKPTDSHWQD